MLLLKINNKFDTQKKRLILAIVVFIMLLLVTLLYIKIFEKFHLAIPCVFHQITGFFCPGCGATRVIIALINLDFSTALKQNAILTFLFPILAIYFIDKIVAWIRQKKPIFADKIPNIIWIIIVIILLIFGIIRNIPGFEFLRPF